MATGDMFSNSLVAQTMAVVDMTHITIYHILRYNISHCHPCDNLLIWQPVIFAQTMAVVDDITHITI